MVVTKTRKRKPKGSEVTQPQHPWLREAQLAGRQPIAKPNEAASRAAEGPSRLLDRKKTIALVGLTFPTVWKMMRQGNFPRSRIVGGKSMWLSSELDAWMTALPRRRLKGDPE